MRNTFIMVLAGALAAAIPGTAEAQVFTCVEGFQWVDYPKFYLVDRHGNPIPCSMPPVYQAPPPQVNVVVEHEYDNRNHRYDSWGLDSYSWNRYRYDMNTRYYYPRSHRDRDKKRYDRRDWEKKRDKPSYQWNDRRDNDYRSGNNRNGGSSYRWERNSNYRWSDGNNRHQSDRRTVYRDRERNGSNERRTVKRHKERRDKRRN